jgi:dGTP triphosphohydrolase
MVRDKKEVVETIGGGLRHSWREVGLFIKKAGAEVRHHCDEHDFMSQVVRSGVGRRVDEPSRYSRILRVTDYVSGMTDRHAPGYISTPEGHRDPGRIG